MEQLSFGVAFALVGTGFGLGLRHGVDWDHIAAIADVTAAQESRLKSMLLGTLYALGHALVVVLLGLLAIWFGSRLPEWIDPYMDSVVGVTLLLLGAWILWTLVTTRGHLVMRSRWMLIFDMARSAYRKFFSKRRTDAEMLGLERRGYGPGSSTAIGMIHGIGAETGTQALLLASAAGATSPAAGSVLLLAFAIGLVMSNGLITIASSLGYIGTRARRSVQIALGGTIAAFSLTLGALFLFQRGDLLPGFFA